MKNVVLSADGEIKVYSVPNLVADNLSKYCFEFSNKWLKNSPDAKKYRKSGIICYNEEDFIEYLNTYLFPHEKSFLVKNLGWIDYSEKIPQPYCNYPNYHF